MFDAMLEKLEELREELENADEAQGDTEALTRMNLANTLAGAAQMLRALAADEEGNQRLHAAKERKRK